MNMERGIHDETVLKSDSIDDFEHLEHVAGGGTLGLVDIGQTVSLVDAAATKLERNLLDTTIPTASLDEFLKPTPATPPPSAEFGKFILDPNPSNIVQDKLESLGDSNYYNNQLNMEQSEEKMTKVDAKLTTMSFIQTERGGDFNERGSFDKDMFKGNVGDIDLLLNQQTDFHDDNDDAENKKDEIIKPEKDQFSSDLFGKSVNVLEASQETGKKNEDIVYGFGSSSVLPASQVISQDLIGKDSLEDECQLSSNINSTFTSQTNAKNDFPWNSNEDLQPPTKPLPPVPANDYDSDPVVSYEDDNQANESDDSEFESEIESSPIKVSSSQLPSKINVSSATAPPPPTTTSTQSIKKIINTIDDEIAPSQIFSNMGLDAWFNPERLNPRVAALIYWRRPEETGIVFGGILGILLSLAYFSLISVFSYAALLSLTATLCYRIYKTVMQAVQKTSDGHPFKDILEYDLKVPAEKVHEVADVAVAHVNASVTELRRLFLIEDFIDSLKFGVMLWSLTYVGSWFNGMTLIIIGVVALFTLPKIYETNKTQIDQNLALVQAKINELTAKVKAAIPLGKKIEPAKEE